MLAKPNRMDLQGVVGFAGHVPSGLILHKDQTRLIYPLGCTIVLKRLLKHQQEFLVGHQYPISALCMNKEGTLLASGEDSHMGFTARIIVWDLQTMKMKYELNLHKAKVQSLAFSPNGAYLASLGGEDDNKLILWDLATGDAICGSSAANDSAKVVKFFNNDSERMVSAGKYHIRTWKIERANRKMRPTDCKLGAIKRVVHTVVLDAEDAYIYAGTLSGDVICINAEKQMFKGIGPRKKPFGCGVQVMELTKSGDLLIASGDGTIALMSSARLNVRRRKKIEGKITSIQFEEKKEHFFIGTQQCSIYCVALSDFEHELRSSAHYKPVHAVAFPPNFSNLFVTAANDIRVWNRNTLSELLRIQIPNLECHCITISKDGKQIVSGWSDGRIRAFTPQTGQLIYVINDAHFGKVNSIVLKSDCETLISGGDDGCVRVWKATLDSQTLTISWKEHTSPVTHLELNASEEIVLSASGDGSCIMWDLVMMHRINALFAQNQFTHIAFHPDQSQIITTGADRKITWWCATDLETIRVVDGSDSAIVNSLSLDQTGDCFASAGGDQVVKVWNYDMGEVTHEGVGHSGVISDVVISPDKSNIVSVGEECGVFVWKFPKQHDSAVVQTEV